VLESPLCTDTGRILRLIEHGVFIRWNNSKYRKVKVKVSFCTAYCYETVVFQYAIVADQAGVQACG